MADIFWSATQVDVWLGLPGAHDEVAFNVARFLSNYPFAAPTESNREVDGACSPDRWRKGFLHLQPLQISLGSRGFGLCKRFSKGATNALFHCGEDCIPQQDLYDRFSRFALTADIQCLSDTGARPDTDAVSTLDKSQTLKAMPLYTTPTSHGPLSSGYESAVLFMDLLLKTSHLKASEPRDRVFALKPIAEMRTEGVVKVDYAIAELDLWRDVTRFFPEELDSPSEYAQLFALPATQCTSTQASSSWVTDYGALTAESRRKRKWYESESRFYSAGGMRYGDSLLLMESSLHRQAVLLSQIQHIHCESNMPLLPESSASIWDLEQAANKVFRIYLICADFYEQIDGTADGADGMLFLAQGQRHPSMYPISRSRSSRKH